MGQTIFAIGALILLSTVVLSINSTIVNQQGWSVGTEAIITGTAIGQALIEEITVKRFDDDWPAKWFCDDSSRFVSSSSLGPDTDSLGVKEVADTSFNDIDDYNNFSKTVNTERLGNFNLKCNVYYVDNNFAKTNNQSFYKQIDVIVNNQYIPSSDTLHSTKVSTIVAYRKR